jgi:hypothetical protein
MTSVRSVLALVALAISLSCGGPGDTRPQGTVRGRAFASSPIAGATVRVYRLDEAGARVGEVGQGATTAADGSFEVPVESAYGVLELEVGGGSYTEVTGTEITLGAGSVLNALVVGFQPTDVTDGVIITPLTHMATSLAHARVAAGKETTMALAADQAYELIGDHFFSVDIGDTVPSALTNAIGTVTEDERYGLILHGLSEQAHVIAEANALTDQALTSVSVATKLAQDLGSTEALFNGDGVTGALMLCTPLGQCAPCVGLCTVDGNVTRSGLAQALLAYFNDTSHNHSGATYDLMRTQLDDLRLDTNEELYDPNDLTEELDNDGPEIVFESPASFGTVTGATVTLIVTATDDTSVQSLVVTIGGVAAPEDTDLGRARYQAVFDSNQYPDGDLEIAATALDALGNSATEMMTVRVNNADAGSISGECEMSADPVGQMIGAAVTAYQFEGGVLGPAMGTASVDNEGNFTITGVEGYGGPVLLTCGGSTADYTEAAMAVSVSFSSTEFLRTVVPVYADGENVMGVVITPWTSLATAYLESQMPADAVFIDAWREAYVLISEHFLDVGDISSDLPVLGTGTATFTPASRYALSLAGLSQSALRIAEDSGATFGAGVSAKSLWKVLETDLADGCLNGRNGSILQIGGAALSSEELRYLLAEGITTYMIGPENPSALDKPADAIDWLDHLSHAGPNTGDGTTCAVGELFPGAGRYYDRVPPTVQWLSPTPAEGAFVRGTISVKAQAIDEITAGPVARWQSPAITDTDGLASVVAGTYDTATRTDGALALVVEAEDAATNISTTTRNFTIDNTPPVVLVNGVSPGDRVSGDVTVTVAITELNLASSTITVDGGIRTSPMTISGSGAHTIVASAIDRAGNTASQTVAFTIDLSAPTISWGSTPSSGSVVGSTLTATLTASDSEGIKRFDIVAPSGAADGAPAVDTIVYSETAAANVEYERTLTVEAEDNVGNTAPATRTFRFDTLKPVVNISVPQWNPSSVVPTWTATDGNLDTVTATLDGSSFAAGTSVTGAGQHTLVVTAIDRVPLSQTATAVFYVDSGAPTINVTAPNAYMRGAFTVVAVLSDALQSSGSLTGGAFTATAEGNCMSAAGSSTTVLGDGSIRMTVSFATTTAHDGPCTIRFNGKDRVQNAAPEATATFTVDNTPPTVLSVTGSRIDAGAKRAWTKTTPYVLSGTSSDNNSLYYTTVTVNGVSSIVSLASWSTNVTVATGVNTLSVTATDTAGNVGPAFAGLTSIFLDATAPTIAAPTISPTPATTGYVKGVVTVSAVMSDAFASEGSLGLANATMTKTLTGSCAGVSTTDVLVPGQTLRLDVTLPASTPDGSCTVRFDGVDQANNAASSQSVTFTVDNTKPVVAITSGVWFKVKGPTIAGTVTDAFAKNVTLSVCTSVGATCRDNSWSAVTPVTPSSGTWSATISDTLNLAEGYHQVKAVATDLAGNTSDEVPMTIAVDTQAPLPIVVTQSDGSAVPAYKAGTLTLIATLSDAQDPDSLAPDSLTVTAPVTSPLGGATSCTVTPTSMGGTSGDSRTLTVTLSTTGCPGGSISITFKGTDRAGNSAPDKTVAVTIDNVPPTMLALTNVTSGVLGATWYTSNTTPTLTGTVTDNFVSPVTVTIQRTGGGTTVASATTGSWTATSPTLASGSNSLTLSLSDTAGTTTLSSTINLDQTGPTVTLATPKGTVEDESTYPITGFNSSTAQANFTYSTSTVVSLDGGGGTVKKYLHRLTDTSTNPIAWKFEVSDPGVGLKTSAGGVQFRVRHQTEDPSTGWTAFQNASMAAPVSGIATVTANVTSGVEPDLLTRDGVFYIELKVLDLLDNQSATFVTQWNYVPLAPPVFIEKLPFTSTPSFAAQAVTSARLESDATGDTMSNLVNTSGTTRKGIVRYKVRNGYGTDSYVGFYVPATSVTATYSGTVSFRSKNLGVYTPPGTLPTCVKNGSSFKIEGSVYTCHGAGWTQPANTEQTRGPTAYGTTNPFVASVSAFGAAQGIVPRCTTGGCTTTLDNNAYYEFKVPANTVIDDDAVYIVLEMDDFKEINPLASGTTYPTITEVSGILASGKISGALAELWAQCVGNDPDTGLCNDWDRFQYYKAIKTAAITSATGVWPRVRARPSPLVLNQNIAKYSYYVDEDTSVLKQAFSHTTSESVLP